METAFLVSAILGATLMICQLVAGLVGFWDHDTDHDHDHGGDHHGNWFLGMLSVRTITAAMLFFGLGGLTAGYYGAEEPIAFGIALVAGFSALYAVSATMNSLAGLKADGTARVERSVGRAGTVYLRIPAAKSGAGKIHLMLQNRTVEYLATTSGAELPTGTPIKVLAVISPDTVEVEAA